MLGEINNLKEILYKELDTRPLDKEKILRVSRELDALIIEYYSGNIAK